MAFLRDKQASVFFWVLFVFPFFVFAQTDAQQTSAQKVYEYKNIDVVYTVRPDTTVRVEETQTYNFILGEFHQGWREIPRNKIDAVSDISIIDVDSGVEYKRSSKRLTKTDPTSWGKYAVFNENGKTIIEWYYEALSSVRTWKIEYTIHGALGFFNDVDELYLNVFDSYSVPVRASRARVVLPEGAHPLQSDAFRINDFFINKEQDTLFSSFEFMPGEAFTIKVSWPKGFVNRSEYIWSFLRFHYGSLFFFILLFSSLIISGIHIFLRRKKENHFRGTIIPEYEPPKNYRPLFAEVAARGYISGRGLSATVIDLAVRGYLTIEEDIKPAAFDIFKKIRKENTTSVKVSKPFLKILLVLIICGFFAFAIGIVPAIVIFLIIMIFSGVIRGLAQKDYILRCIKDYKADTALEQFEREYLDILFESSEMFSTRELRAYKSKSQQEKMHSNIEELKSNAIQEIEGDTKAYTRSITRSKKFLLVALPIFLVGTLVFQFLNNIGNGQISWLLSGLLVSTLIILWMFYFRPLLSDEGKKLREEWLGFKMYLETAEKHRLENLTPESFEKFLPYAMVFKLEKKWARAFEGMNVPPPQWYHGAFVGSMIGTSSANSFSPAAFSSSFSSSFSSAFSAGTSGGGSAGGGGGGGGGGAS